MIKKFTMVLISLLLASCSNISSPDDYLTAVLSDASGCDQGKIVIDSERYVHPSSIWTIRCGEQKFECYEKSTGFKQISGYVSRKMYCDKV